MAGRPAPQLSAGRSSPPDNSLKGRLAAFVQVNPLISLTIALAGGLVVGQCWLQAESDQLCDTGAAMGATVALKEKEDMPSTPTWMARREALDRQQHEHNE